jgi:hypothetical protein
MLHSSCLSDGGVIPGTRTIYFKAFSTLSTLSITEFRQDAHKKKYIVRSRRIIYCRFKIQIIFKRLSVRSNPNWQLVKPKITNLTRRPLNGFSILNFHKF